MLLGSSVTSFALNEYFDSMSQVDKGRLEKFCVFAKSERAKIARNELIEKMKLLDELQ